jgi:hypothetical protein
MGVRVRIEASILSYPRRADRVLGTPNLLFSGYLGLFSRESGDPAVKLTTYFQLVPRSRLRGCIHPLPHGGVVIQFHKIWKFVEYYIWGSCCIPSYAHQRYRPIATFILHLFVIYMTLIRHHQVYFLSLKLLPDNNIFFLWLCSPILGHGRLHETFRFISDTRFRTVSWTPWTGDQLVARPLLTAPGNCDDDEVGGTKILAGKPKYSEKTSPDATLSTTNPTCQIRAQTRSVAVGSQRLTASAMARPR